MLAMLLTVPGKFSIMPRSHIIRAWRPLLVMPFSMDRSGKLSRQRALAQLGAVVALMLVLVLVQSAGLTHTHGAEPGDVDDTGSHQLDCQICLKSWSDDHLMVSGYSGFHVDAMARTYVEPPRYPRFPASFRANSRAPPPV